MIKRAALLLMLVLFTKMGQAQFSCSKVRLYDQMVVKGDQPMLHKLKPYDVKLIPETTLLNMKKEIIKTTSLKFFEGLKIHSAKLCDTAQAKAWSWTNPPIIDKDANPVYFFYCVLFETKTTNNEPFIFRLDVLKNGTLLNKNQISFLKNKKLTIIGCNKVTELVLKDTLQPISTIEDMALAYSPKEQSVIWTVNSVLNTKTGIKHHKQVDAITGTIISRSITDMNQVPEVIKIEN